MPDPDTDPSPANDRSGQDEERQRLPESISLIGASHIGLFVLASVFALYFIRPILLPLILAFLITLLLKPIHHRLQTFLRMPAPPAAMALMAVVIATVATGLYYFAIPAAKYAGQLREEIVQNRLRTVFQPIKSIHGEITQVAEKVEDFTEPPPSPGNSPATEQASPSGAPQTNPSAGDSKETRPPATAPDSLTTAIDKAVGEAAPDAPSNSSPPVQVEIRENRVEIFYDFARVFSLHAFVTFALVFFFLSFGDRLIRRLGEIDLAAELIDRISLDVSRYLLTITTINTGLGIITAIAMSFLGMPNPILWGVMAAFLNYIPYFGAITGTIIVCLVAAISFEDSGEILPVPLVYYALTAIEGYFITPTIIGRRFTVNPIIVFVWVLSWGALWAIPGLLIALPLLMVFRIVCARLPALSRLDRLLSA